MTKKDYIKIATVLKMTSDISIQRQDGNFIMDLDRLINDFVEMLKEDGSSFDKEKFIKFIENK